MWGLSNARNGNSLQAGMPETGNWGRHCEENPEFHLALTGKSGMRRGDFAICHKARAKRPCCPVIHSQEPRRRIGRVRKERGASRIFLYAGIFPKSRKVPNCTDIFTSCVLVWSCRKGVACCIFALHVKFGVAQSRHCALLEQSTAKCPFFGLISSYIRRSQGPTVQVNKTDSTFSKTSLFQTVAWKRT